MVDCSGRPFRSIPAQRARDTGLGLARREPAASLNQALDADSARRSARLLGEIQLVVGDGATYAECDNAAERAVRAVGGVSLVLVAGVGFEPTTFGL